MYKFTRNWCFSQGWKTERQQHLTSEQWQVLLKLWLTPGGNSSSSSQSLPFPTHYQSLQAGARSQAIQRSGSQICKIITCNSCSGHLQLSLPSSWRCPCTLGTRACGFTGRHKPKTSLNKNRKMKVLSHQFWLRNRYLKPMRAIAGPEVSQALFERPVWFHTWIAMLPQRCSADSSLKRLLAYPEIQGKIIRSHKLWNVLRFTSTCFRYPECSLSKRGFNWAQQI